MSSKGFDKMSMFSGFCGGGGGVFRVGSDLLRGPLMAEDSCSKEMGEEKDDGWLQLSLGRNSQQYQRADDQRCKKSNGLSLLDLELMPSNSSASNCLPVPCSQIRASAQSPELPSRRPATNFPGVTGFNLPSSYFQNMGASSSIFHQNQDINTAFKPAPISAAAAADSSAPSFSFRPSKSIPVTDFRLVQPPRRPHSGIWFMLLASENQEKQPLLPQITRRYLRIKDGRMPVSLVLKYLVNKLTLESESEIEIRCKGEKVDPWLTLQQVRDRIWSKSPKELVTLLPNLSTPRHIMVLHYAPSNLTNYLIN